MLFFNHRIMKAQTKKLFHFRPLFYSFLMMTLAIACARFVFAGRVSYIVLVCGIFVFLFSLCLWMRKLVYFVIMLAVFGFGIGWYFFGVSTFKAKEFSGQCVVQGRISDDLSYSDYENSFNVVLKNVRVNDKKVKNISLTVNFQDVDEIRIGDVITFSSELDCVKLFELGKFNSFYYRDNVGYSAEISTSQIKILRNKLTIDEKIRQKVKSAFSKMKNGGIAYAVLFGDKSDISHEVKDAFVNSGVVHLLTVSGLHISFLIALLGFVLKKCKVRGWINLSLCTGFVIFYSFLCGFTPSVLRAGIMGLVLSLASAFGKRYDSLNALGLAGCIILLCKPLFALDIGFLMSFFCVLSIFSLYPLCRKFFESFLPKKVAEGIAVSISAQFGIFPFVLQINESTNLLSVFANLIIVPIFSVVYPVLFIGTLLVLLMPFLSFILKVCDFGFVVICKLAEFFGQTGMVANVQSLNSFAIAFGFLLMLSLSKFFMASRRAKAICFSVLLCLSCVCVIAPDFWDKPKAGISVCYEYSNGIVLLTNNACESVIIDVRSKSFTKKLLKVSKVDKVSAVFVLQSPRVKIDTIKQIGCESIIRTGDGEGYAQEKLVDLEEVGRVGHFSYRYRSDAGKMIGIELMFDGMKVFVARQNYTLPENFEDVGQEEFDFVVLGKLKNCDTKFQKTSKIASFYRQNGSFSSFERDGNMSFLLKNKQFVGRNID